MKINLKDKIQILENVIKELKKELENEENKHKTIYDIKKGDIYYFVDGQGTVNAVTYTGSFFCKAKRDFNNMFIEKQDAYDEIRVRKLIALAKKSQKGFKPDWKNNRQEKWTVFYSFYDERLKTELYYCVNDANRLGQWSNKKDLNDFIHTYMQDLIWFFTEYNG